MSNRIKLIFIIYLLAFTALSVRLFYWQVIKSAELAQKAKNQYLSGDSNFAPRGEILASDGSWLAATVETYQLFANPKKVELNTNLISGELAEIIYKETNLGDDEYKLLIENEEDRIENLLSKKNLNWVAIKNKITPDIKKNIEKLEIEGLGFDEERSRYLPEGSASAHLLGFVGKDDEGQDKGYFGLEGKYDITLTGKSGYSSSESDLLGNPLLLNSKRESSAIEGISLKTTIDKIVQNSVHKKLGEGINKYGAEGGSVIVMDPKDGSIIAMESYPTFDPSVYWNYGNEYFINPAVSLSYEPGSVFKILVMAAGLDAGVVNPNTICDKCAGPLKIGSYNIRTWDDQYHQNSTMTDIIVHSDNVGMAFVANKLGPDRLYEYLSNFGFGEKTGIDLQGELSPILRKKGTWKEIDTATTSFGQGIAVTSMQMIRATGAIANNGILPNPYVVRTLIGNGWEEDIKRESGKRVISEKAADDITLMMVEAATKGESKWTSRPGYGVAGKTGTAQIPIEGHYDEEETIASFVGFAPYYDPKFVMLVTLKRPKSSPWASETAAPLWYLIADDLFDYYKLKSKN